MNMRSQVKPSGGATHYFRLLVDLPQDRCLARLGSGAWFVALFSAACAGRVALIWPARTGYRHGRGEAQEGSVQPGVAVPSWLAKISIIGQEEQDEPRDHRDGPAQARGHDRG